MHMSIPLLTAERENVESFSRNNLPESFSHSINESLKLKVLLQSKVPSGLFPVISWSNEYVPIANPAKGSLTPLGNQDGTACLLSPLFFERKPGRRSAQTPHFCAILITHGRQ